MPPVFASSIGNNAFGESKSEYSKEEGLERKCLRLHCTDTDTYVCSFKEKQCAGWFKSKHSYIEVLVRKHLTLVWAVQAALCATQHWAAACSERGFTQLHGSRLG